MKHFISILLVLCLICSVSVSCAENNTADVLDECIGGIIAYTENSQGAGSLQALADSFLADAAGTGAEWYVISLVKAGYQLDFSGYLSKLNTFIDEHPGIGATSRQRIALALIATGENSDYLKSTVDATTGQLGIMSYVYGLHLLNNNLPSEEHEKESIIKTIIDLQNDDGGWSVTGRLSDIDVTAMVLQSFAPYYETDTSVSDACASALSLLSSRQLSDGGYQSYGVPNAESCAQVLIALTSLGIDPLTDGRFNKNGSGVFDALLSFRLSDGSFTHAHDGSSNSTATVQALMALVAFKNYQSGYGPFHILGDNPVTKETVPVSCRTWVCAAIIAIAIAASGILFLLGKKNTKNFIFLAVIALSCVILVLTTEFSTVRDYYQKQDISGQKTGTASISITCAVLDGADSAYTPDDCVILPPAEFDITADYTVRDLLIAACKSCNIQMEMLGSGTLAYISGIGYIYEYDYGDLSGWMYSVNGNVPSIGCGEYKLKDGDIVEWFYTRELGRDLGYYTDFDN